VKNSLEEVLFYLNKKILVIGDFCIDRFVYGSSSRINPEAPVPIFNPTETIENYGMSGNVAANLASLGYDVDLICNKNKIIKTRFVDIESNHMHLRVDENDNVSPKDSYKDADIVFDTYDAVVLTDHDKGFISEQNIQEISNKHRLVFLQSNKLIGDWARNIAYLKINMKEFLRSEEFIRISSLMSKTIITDGANGCFFNDDHFKINKTVVTRDLSGAGDTFLSVFVDSILNDNNVNKSILKAQNASIEIVQQRGVATIGDIENEINFL